MQLSFGKETTSKSFFNGRLINRKVSYSIPIKITGDNEQERKTRVLTEIMKTIDLIDSKETFKIDLCIEANPTTYQIKMVTKKYDIDEQCEK